jgi:aminoglycoside phosphotransferase
VSEHRASHPSELFGADFLTETISPLKRGAWRLRSWRLTRVIERPPTRILFYQIRYESGGGQRVRTARLVAKLYGDHRGPRAIAGLRRLRQAGFRAPAPDRVPRPYGYSAGRRALLQARAPGVMWADVLRDDPARLAAASAQAADWLIQLQRCPVDSHAGSHTEDLAVVERCAAELGSGFPGYAARLRSPTQRLLSRLGGEAMDQVVAHGDYHPENVFLAAGGKTTVIDFDGLGRREPAFDVGYAIGQLLAMSYVGHRDHAPGARAATAFWQRYQLCGSAPWPRVALHAARSVLLALHFELCALGNQRADLLEPWTALIEAWLRSEGTQTLEALVGDRSGTGVPI